LVLAGKARDDVLVTALAALLATCTNPAEGGAAIVKVRVAVTVPVELVALKVTVADPAAVGVPEIDPVVVFTDNPAGRPVAPYLVGEFVAVI
jgi:hypothetical protein